MTTPSNKKGWKKTIQFNIECGCTFGECLKCSPLIVLFNNLLSQQRQEILGEFEEHINDLGMDSNDEEDLLEYLLGIIKQLKEGGKI